LAAAADDLSDFVTSEDVWFFMHCVARRGVSQHSRPNGMTHCFQTRRAFSLMELLAVVTVLGILAALLLPRIALSTDKAKQSSCLHNRTEIDITVERYYIHTGDWPDDNLGDIGADLDYFPDGLPVCPVSGDAYQLDPTSHRVIGHSGPGDH
jgi:prepilin-type N-terminal cleavage/methylation domain-containing protein